MPQLNPAPWFVILVFSWTVLLVIIPPKIMAFTYPSPPSSRNVTKQKSGPWTWPWH